MSEQQMIQMDKDVIERLIDFMSNTTKVSGFNEGQLKEGKVEIERLCNQILKKAEYIGGSYLLEQQLFVSNTLKNI